jgi:polyribonucleotide nucleotidyltransferase
MFNVIKREIEWGGHILSLETGHIGRQASSVIVRYGNTTIMCNITVAQRVTTGIDFVPLTVNYVEKFYAAGRIPGGFIKRESKPSDNEVLIARTIDRSIRPLFPEGYRNETNIFCTLLSFDEKCPTDIVAIIGVSATLAISPIPVDDIIAGVKVRYRDENFELNTFKPFDNNGKLDLTIAGTDDSILMVESEVKELNENDMLNALSFGHREVVKIVDFIKSFATQLKVDKIKVDKIDNDELISNIKKFAESDLKDAFSITQKQERNAKLNEISDKVREKFIGDSNDEILSNTVDNILKNIEKNIVRTIILKDFRRIDGRKIDQVRAITSEIDILPVVHGSALFTRGETQALVVTTLGSLSDEQMIDNVSLTETSQKFILHYNFPPFATGEVGRLGSPGRREIGHGKLAWKAIHNMVDFSNFEYTVRVVSEICESNGSSSMATVCGTSLSLMASGVPLKSPIAGIAMGLIKEKEEFIVLSDIMGDEDHLGDMDFKVAGTRDGITALQMDIKCKGVNHDIMEKALIQAKSGRFHILDKMAETITESRKDVSSTAPGILTIKINPDRIREVIGKQGKIIKEIIEKTKTSIDIEDNGTIKILSNSAEQNNLAASLINDIVGEKLEMNAIYTGKIVKILPVGAFVNIGDVDAFLHISQVANYRINDIKELLKEGDIINVKYIGIDQKTNKPKVSYKDVEQNK